LRIIPEASHLFDNNEGMIEEVAKITSEWLSKNIGHEWPMTLNVTWLNQIRSFPVIKINLLL
jgi:hypothetical protein